MNLNRLTFQDVAMATRSSGSTPRKGSIGPGFKVPIKPAKKPVNATVAKPASNSVAAKNKKADKVAKIKGVPFINLYANALHTDAKYVADVSVTLLKKGEFNDWPGFLSATITVDGNGRPRRYKHHVVAKDGLPIRKSQAVHVVCNCPRFLYYWEYALASRGSADILYCNGEPPVITNPRLVPSMCKHLLAVFNQIVRKKL